MKEREEIIRKVVEGDIDFHHKIPAGLYERILEFIEERKYVSRTSAINDLLKIAIIVTKNIEKIKDPEFVAEVKAQFQEGGLVDYVERLNPRDLEILWSIVRNEHETRKNYQSTLFSRNE